MGKWTMPVQGSFFLHTYITPTSGRVKWYKNYFLHERVFHEPVVSGQSWRGSVPHLWPCEMIQKLFLKWTCLPGTCGLWTELEGFCSPPLALWNDTKIISYMNVSSRNLWSMDRAGGVLFPTSVKWYKNKHLLSFLKCQLTWHQFQSNLNTTRIQVLVQLHLGTLQVIWKQETDLYDQ